MNLLRKLRIKYEGHESLGEVTISTSAIRDWFRATQSANQKARSRQAVEKNSLSCKADSLASVTITNQRLSRHSLGAIENVPVM